MKKNLPHYLRDEFIDKNFRCKLDYSYHTRYDLTRARLQNQIIRKLFTKSSITETTSGSYLNSYIWFILTAGPIGSGKSSVLRFFLENNYIPIRQPLIVDMDQIREYLPESNYYQTCEPMYYGEKTQKESGCIAELLVSIGLYSNRSIIIDGSMNDKDWQRIYLMSIKKENPQIKVLLLHVSSSPTKIRERIAARNSLGGRIVPSSYVESSINTLNDWKQFQQFEDIVDLFVALRNDDDSFNPSIYYPWFFNFEKVKQFILYPGQTSLDQTIPCFSNYNTEANISDCLTDTSPLITEESNEIVILSERIFQKDVFEADSEQVFTASSISTDVSNSSMHQDEWYLMQKDEWLSPIATIKSISFLSKHRDSIRSKAAREEGLSCILCKLDNTPCTKRQSDQLPN